MRYTSAHHRVRGLLERFPLSSYPFPVHEQQNIAYLRGHRLRWQDMTLPSTLPYNLRADERTEMALEEGFVVRAAKQVLRQILERDVTLSEQDWQEAKARAYRDGRFEYPLAALPLRYVLQRCVSGEALRFADDVSGYNSILTNWNAFDGFRWNTAEFAATREYFGIREGFAELPRKILACFKRCGGTTEDRHKLKEIRWASGDRRLELVFAGHETSPAIVDRVILAMPRRALELVNTREIFPDTKGAGRDGPGSVRRLIRSVTPVPLFKLALCYSYPWWETIDPMLRRNPQPRIMRGESVTDLPIRQCYYWAKDRKTNRAVVLIYDDGRDLDYWSGLRDVQAQKPFRPEGPLAGIASADWEAHGAPDIMVREAHRQLLDMHGAQDREDIPDPYAASYQDWNEDPYGGGVNFWGLDIDSAQVSRDIVQPRKDVPVFICGEAYSERHQGWVEGALDTAELVLKEFGIKSLLA